MTGWYIDTVSLATSHYACCIGPATITAIHPSPANVVLNVNSITGVTYTLEYKNRLTDTQWLGLPPSTTGTGGALSLKDTNPPAPTRFYRVRSN